MDGLCRELGDRGRADSIVRTASSANVIGGVEMATASVDVSAEEGHVAMRSELEGLRATQLLQRARVEGVDDKSLEDAQDSDTPKETLIGLLMNHVLSRSPAERMATTLERGGEGR